jgi:isopenicillin N synthase-like dioxygenase
MVHRVVRHPEQSERYTLGYFAPPNLKRRDKIDPWIVNEHNQYVDILERALKNQTKFISPVRTRPVA